MQRLVGRLCRRLPAEDVAQRRRVGAAAGRRRLPALGARKPEAASSEAAELVARLDGRWTAGVVLPRSIPAPESPPGRSLRTVRLFAMSTSSNAVRPAEIRKKIFQKQNIFFSTG